jgi:hypothetical protein
MTKFSFGKKSMIKMFLFFIAALLASCAMSPKAGIVYDESIAVDETAWVYPANIGTIIGYNGIEVEWKINPYSYNFIQIPAGDTLLEWNIDAYQGSMIYKINNVLFRYNFPPGKQYYFTIGRDPQANESDTGSLGLKVHLYNIGEKSSTSFSDIDKHYYGFAPFLNVDAGRRTVLE